MSKGLIEMFEKRKIDTFKLYEDLPREKRVEYIENPVPPQFLDKILCKSSESMEELPDNSIHLMVTSPPYNVGKDYGRALTLKEYREFLKRVWKEVYRVLVPGAGPALTLQIYNQSLVMPLEL